MTAKYQWAHSEAPGGAYGDATRIVEHLEYLRSKDDLTPELLMADAEKHSSPLHGMFEWHNATAAERFRRVQLSRLMGRLVKTNGHTPQRVYMKTGTGDTAQFDLVSRVLRNPELRKPYARRALLELQSWQLRYSDFPELRSALAALRGPLRTIVRPALKVMEEAGVV